MKSVRDAAGQLTDRFHLLRLAQRFLAPAALRVMSTASGTASMIAPAPVVQRVHREVETAVARSGKLSRNIGPDFLAAHHVNEGVADGVTDAFGAGNSTA